MVLIKLSQGLGGPILDISGTYSGLDYSSAEDEDFPTPIANSTRRGGRAPEIVNTAAAGRNGSGGGKRGGRGEEGAVTSRVTRRCSRENSRSGEEKNSWR